LPHLVTLIIYQPPLTAQITTTIEISRLFDFFVWLLTYIGTAESRHAAVVQIGYWLSYWLNGVSTAGYWLSFSAFQFWLLLLLKPLTD